MENLMIYLSTFGMNAGFDNENDFLLKSLARYQHKFKKIFICDGDLTEKAKEYYSRLENVEVEDFPWNDDYSARYIRNISKVPNGEWVLHLDSDEIPSKSLMNFLFEPAFEEKTKEYNTLCLPCILHLSDDGKTYHAVERWPLPEYEGQWMKNILVKKDSTLDFKNFGSHVISHHGDAEKACYVPFPYMHMKTLESFVYNDAYQAYLHPKGQGLSDVDAKLFSLFTKVYKTTKEFKTATKNGKWSPALKKFAWERRLEVGNAVSRLAWVYFILEGHEMPEQDDLMKWDHVKQFVLDKDKLDLMNRNKEDGRGITV